MSPDSKQTVLVTGASGGIGLDLARLFARDGHDLVLVARSEPRLAELAAELKQRHRVAVTVLPQDLAQDGAAARIAEELRRRGIEPDILVNNAGAGVYGRFSETDPDDVSRMIRLNVLSLAELTRLLLPRMIERRRGRVLNVASTAAFQPGPLLAVYYATKAFVLSFSEAVAQELAGTGVTVTALCPGPTETGFRDAAGMKRSMMNSNFLNMDSQSVARAGYEGLLRGRRLVVPGFTNRLGVFLVRLAPRGLVVRTVERMQMGRAG